MMIPVIDAMTNTLNYSALLELLENNCTGPDVRRILFNLKTIEDHAERDADGNLVIDEATGKPKRVRTACAPKLTTTIEFVDNTRCVVSNGINDKVDVTQKTLEDGSVVTVATDAAKEAGICYCILKRWLGKVDENGLVVGNGFGHTLRDLVDSAYDESYESAKNKVSKSLAKKRYEEQKANAKPKEKNPSLLDTVKAMADNQRELAEMIKVIKEDLASAKAV